MSKQALLALADGSLFYGDSIGNAGIAVGEIVFNTAMTGYQEILTDPSYAEQIICLTTPHVGNVGTNSHDEESDTVWAKALVIRDYSFQASSWRNQLSLGAYLQQHNVVGISGIDTRRLTRILQKGGVQSACVMAGEIDCQVAINAAKNFSGLSGQNLASQVTTQRQYHWCWGSWGKTRNEQITAGQTALHIVVYDFGVKRNILRLLVDFNCRLTIVPANTSAKAVFQLNPDGIFLSNGPGDPAACADVIDTVKELLVQQVPIFGICLGHQLLALAGGAKSIKMKHGHHAANHPVENLKTGQVFISSQNHGFTIDEQTLPSHIEATHRSLFDGSLQGIRFTNTPAMGFQGHPESSPGPHELQGLFHEYLSMVIKYAKTH